MSSGRAQLGLRSALRSQMQGDDAGAPGGRAGKGQINFENILKLIPGEVVPIFIAGSGLTVAPIAGIAWPSFLFWICFITCAILRTIASKPDGGTWGSVNWALVGVSLVAFFMWAHAVSVAGPVISGVAPAAWGILAMIVGVVAPALVPADH